MSLTRPRSRGLATALAIVLTAVLVGLSAPSHAGPFDGEGTTGNASGTVGRCLASAGPNYLGLVCPTGRSAGGDPVYPPSFLCKDGFPAKDKESVPADTPKSTDGDAACHPVPVCWDSPFTPEELKATQKENTEGPDGVHWFWQRCMSGIDPQILKEKAGRLGVKVDQTPYPRGNSDLNPLRGLTDRQTALVNHYFSPPEAGGNRPPNPEGAASPVSQPRVRTDVSFYDFYPTRNKTGSVVKVQIGDAQLMAVEEYLSVAPRGKDRTDTTTPGRCQREGSADPNDAAFEETANVGHEAKAGETRANAPGCWYKYEQSSYGEGPKDANAYQVDVRAHWTVWQKDGGRPWERFRSLASGNPVAFEKANGFATPIAVSEVQAINILPGESS